MSKKEDGSSGNDKSVDVDNFVENGDFFENFKRFLYFIKEKLWKSRKTDFSTQKIVLVRSIEMCFAKHCQ